MQEAWDTFVHVVPAIDTTKRGGGDFHLVDDWFESSLCDAAYDLQRRHDYDIVWVNYIWLSKIFNAFPMHVKKILDTHDVFSNRNQIFEHLGLEPAWFFTTADQERLALSRADAIVAIQENEADYFRRLLPNNSNIPVFTIGHISCPRFLSPRTRSSRRIRVGYLGSANPLNIKAIEDLQSRLRQFPSLASEYRFFLAGPICSAMSGRDVFEMMGVVDATEDFYREIDIFINPMPSGTGLKIKTVEALSFGRAVAGTRSAFAGISTVELGPAAPPAPFRQLLSADSLYLTADQSRKAFLAYTRLQFGELMDCLSWASASSPSDAAPRQHNASGYRPPIDGERFA
jgi:hypothetical protein